jgi:cysteine desulfurase
MEPEVRIRLDHNATTALRPELLEPYAALLAEGLGNPSSLHRSGRRARQCVDEARERLAAALAVGEDELVFTSGGTEANNLALHGVLAAAGPGQGLAAPRIEHSSVVEPAAAWSRGARPWTVLPTDGTGRLDLEALSAAAADPASALVSVAAANGELGTVQDLGAVVERCRSAGRARVHTDAVQALGRVPVELRAWGVDLASFSAHKVGGPLGVGVLYRRSGTHLTPLLRGGPQEGELRAGTENAAAIAIAARALASAVAERETYAARLRELCTLLWTELLRQIPQARLLGPPIDARERLPNTLCVQLPDVDGRVLVTRLDLAGLEVSAGSACASGSVEPSHVLLALGLDERDARSAIRLSLGRETTAEECRQAVEILGKTCAGEHASRAARRRL